MIDAKRISGSLNLDASYYALPQEDYVDALNITHDAIEGSTDQVVSSIVANRKVLNNNLLKIYTNENYNFVATVVLNGNGTQTVTFTFDTLPGDTTALTKSYFNGTVWVNATGGFTSPQSMTIPEGDWEYRVTIVRPGDDETYGLTEQSGIYKTIGAYANQGRNTVIFFNYNSFGYHAIFEYQNDTRTIVKVLINLTDTNGVDILGFTEEGKITSVNIFNRDEGDLLFFLDSLGRPTGFNIESMKNNVYNPVLRDYIDVAKNVPQSPPSCVYGNDNTKEVNYLRKKFFRFKYIWEDEDYFTTTGSPISKMPIPVDILNDNTVNLPTQNNVIYLSLNSGGANIKNVKILVSYSETSEVWSDFLLLDTVNKDKQGISDNADFSYSFYNESVYPLFDVRHSILLFDYIPIYAKCQGMPNGNVLAYGAVTEGYDNDLEPNVDVSIGSYELSSVPSGSLSAVIQTQTPPQTYSVSYITFSGIPTAGTVINIKLKSFPSNAIVTIGTYTTLAGDTIGNGTSGIIGALITNINTTGLVINAGYGSIFFITYNGENGFNPRYYSDYTEVEIIPPSSSATQNSTPVFKWSSQKTMAIAYFDSKGRTNGVVYSVQVIFAPYSDNSVSGGVFFSSIAVSIYHVPPIWAESYQFLFTKDNTGYLYFASPTVNKSEANYMYFDVTGLNVNADKLPTTSQVLSYSFQDGDRLRVIKEIGATAFFSSDFDTEILGLVVDPVINGVPQTGKKFLKIKKNTFFQDSNFPNTLPYEIEIWRPAQQTASETNKTFFECGLQYFILNPGTDQRVHQGQLQDQTTNYVTPATFLIKEGDAYFRVRSSFMTETGVATYNVVDRNVVDNYISAVNSFEGRPNVIDANARRAKFGATIRHGQAYQVNTNVNGLNRFYPEDFLDVDYSNGDIERLTVRDRFMRAFQQLKTGQIPLFQKISKSPNGDEVLIVTDKLLNPVQYYVGNWGIGTAATSLVSYNFADYFFDNIRGAIVRVSNNGTEPISILYNVNSWANIYVTARKLPYNIYGAFNQKTNEYIGVLEETDIYPEQTIVFSETRKGFEGFLTYYPEMMCTLGTLLIGFKNGDLWTSDNEPYYNNFFGVQYDSSITPVFNKNPLLKKTYLSIEEIASSEWTCDIDTDTKSYGNVKQQSNLISSDFKQIEGNFFASFWKDSNSIGGIINGDSLKGNWIKIKFKYQYPIPPNNFIVTLNLVNLEFIESPLNLK
jgi:hypothetical protein